MVKFRNALASSLIGLGIISVTTTSFAQDASDNATHKARPHDDNSSQDGTSTDTNSEMTE